MKVFRKETCHKKAYNLSEKAYVFLTNTSYPSLKVLFISDFPDGRITGSGCMQNAPSRENRYDLNTYGHVKLAD